MTPLPRLMISAAHKSSGKTVVSLGLARALAQSGHQVGTFKKGPDYIDPLWLTAATGRACYNLDFNTMAAEELTGLFTNRAASADISLIEANKGLFDGIALDGSDSNAALAKLMQAPVVLVIDCMGMTRGIAPLLQGYAGFDPEVRIAGVILNKVGGPRHEAKLRQAVEAYTSVPVLGAIRRSADMALEERHLGLLTPAESPGMEAWVNLVAELVAEQCDMDAIAGLAQSAPPLPTPPTTQPDRFAHGLRIGIARDSAFGFYYADDLEAFETAGATLVPIDMLHDRDLPPVDGLFIGGGYPETHMQALQTNTAMRNAVKTALQNGLPCYAECGGLMYLCQSLRWSAEQADMVGFFPTEAAMHAKPQGRGYVRFERTAGHPWGTNPTPQQAHEFHYARVSDPGIAPFRRKVTRGFGSDGQSDGLHMENTLAGFIHLRHSRQSPWVTDFLRFVQQCKTKPR